jgi:hypothetical protein
MRLWHPWLRINRVLRALFQNAMERLAHDVLHGAGALADERDCTG